MNNVCVKKHEKVLILRCFCAKVSDVGVSQIYGGSRVTGVPPGLQNLCWALGASWVGSIPTRVRQK